MLKEKENNENKKNLLLHERMINCNKLALKHNARAMMQEKIGV